MQQADERGPSAHDCCMCAGTSPTFAGFEAADDEFGTAMKLRDAGLSRQCRPMLPTAQKVHVRWINVGPLLRMLHWRLGMNFLVAMFLGLAFGWATYGMLGRPPVLTRRTALVVGAFAATVATQFYPIFNPHETGDVFRFAGFAWAALSSSVSIVIVNLVAGRISRA